MGKKKGKKKADEVKVVEPPFSFHIDNFPANSGQCALHLYDQIEVNFKEIEIEVKVSRHPETRKPQFDLVVVKSKEEPRPHGMYMGEELLPFPILFLETKQTLRVEPLRTGGQQPFIMVDPATGSETPVVAPYFVHYQLTNRKRYLLDLRKFVGGKFKFKDPDTGEEIVVDITQRVDPLSGLPLYGEDKNPDRVFLGPIKSGEVYVVQDPVTEDIQVLEGNGQPALDYQTTYNEDTNITNLLDNQGEVMMVLNGKHTIQLNIPEEILHEMKQETKEGISNPIERYRSAVDPKGKNSMAQETNEGIAKPMKRLSSVEDPKGKKYEEDEELGLDLNLGDGERETDESDDESPDVFRKIMNKAIKAIHPNRADMEEGALIDVDENAKHKDMTEPSTIRDNKGGNVTFDLRKPSEQLHFQRDPKSGIIQVVDGTGHVVDIPDGYRIEKDPVSGTIQLFNEDGDPIDLNALPKDQRGTAEDLIDTDLEEMVPGVRDPQHLARTDSRAAAGLKLSLFREKDKTVFKSEEEKYFDSFKTEDAWAILEEMKTLDDDSKKVLLRGLIEVIEFEKDFVNCAMKTKLGVERKYIDEIYKDKEARQRQFISDIVNNVVNTYDCHEIKKEILDKLDRENEYMFDKINEKMGFENELVRKAMQRELKGNRETIIKISNINCYKRCKRILMKYLAEKLAQEVFLSVKQELCDRFTKESEEIMKTLRQ